MCTVATGTLLDTVLPRINISLVCVPGVALSPGLPRFFQCYALKYWRTLKNTGKPGDEAMPGVGRMNRCLR